jgi:nitrite reductase (NAD(P)H)
MVVEQVRDLGVDVSLGKMMEKISTDDNNNVTGLEFKDGEKLEGACVCVAVNPAPPYVAQSISNNSRLG